MPYFAVKDAAGATIYIAATGSGTTVDPYVPTHTFTNALPAGTAVIGKVDQGAGGASAWKVDGSAVTQPVSVVSLPLPTGAATSAKQDTGNTSVASIDTKTPALGQALAAASVPVILPSATITTLTPPAAITGFATETTLAAASAKLPATLGQTTKAASLSVALASNQDALPITDNAGSLTVDNAGTFAVQAAQSGTWTVQPGNTANSTAWLVKGIRAATPTQTSVTASATSVSILASNSSRLGAAVYNDSTAILYLKLGATASTTSFTVAMAASSYYEVPFQYTGAIDGIWASATGSARITEIV